MGRTFTIWALAVIFVIMVAPVRAQVSLNGAITISDWAEAAGVSSRLNAKRNNRPIGGTSTKMGLQAVIISHRTMTYEASLSTVGIDADKIVSVGYTPDGGKTVWVPNFVPGKGYTLALPVGNTTVVNTRCKVLLPKKRARDRDEWEERTLPITIAGLTPGEMASGEWILTVHDKKNRVIIVIIPITWTSDRRLAMGSDIMVQQALSDFDCLPDTLEGDRKAYAYLRGFIPAWGMPDPSAIAAMEYQNALAQPKTGSTPANSGATNTPPTGNGSDGTVREEIAGSPVKSKTVALELIQVNIYLWALNATKPVVWCAKVDKCWYEALRKESQCVYLTRGGKRISVGEAQVVDDKIEIHFASKVSVLPDDGIDTIEED